MNTCAQADVALHLWPCEPSGSKLERKCKRKEWVNLRLLMQHVQRRRAGPRRVRVALSYWSLSTSLALDRACSATRPRVLALA
jgi:hypothetical protein